MGDHLSRPAVADGLKQSTRKRDEQPHGFLSDLAPSEVYQAGRVTPVAGGLLPHRFTLTPGKPVAVYSLLHCLAGYPGWMLSTALLCGARTFLVIVADAAIALPTHSPLL